ncbi:wax ester/triacylglycerol synthase domain-containing protein [Streptomyces sp. NPDC006435]|uniref:wax ester/triacylglycerol synthase domain-containing protein n=1 Tax=Streptomyces sp. NPDC006435 TaxID=3154300 RepID=UPI00339E447B
MTDPATTDPHPAHAEPPAAAPGPSPVPAPDPNPLDRALLSFDGPQQPVVTLALDFAGPPPAPSALQQRIAERAPALPTFRGTPASNLRVPHTDAADSAALDRETDRISQLPFDLAGNVPPWDVRLITGPDSFRVCLRTHHGFLDGVGATHAAAALLSDTSAEGARLHPPAVPTARALTRSLHDLARTLAGPRPWTPPPSTGPSPSRRTTGRDVPLPVLRHLADTHGVTVNEVALAALGMALARLRREHRTTGTGRDVLATVAVSTRTPQQRHLPGNRLGVHRLILPHRAGTLDESIAAVARQTGAVRNSRQRDALRALLENRTAPQAAARAYRAALRARVTPLVVSSVTVPGGLTAFGAPLCSAALLLNVFEGFPAYVSFTRTTALVRCSAAADTDRSSLLAVPDLWAELLSSGRHAADDDAPDR